MFYEVNKIKSELICKQCLNNFNDKPKILPCGASVCTKCVTELSKQAESSNYSFKCILCSSKHTIPDEGFITNLALFNLLSLEPVNPHIQTLEKNLDLIQMKINQFQLDGSDKIKDYCIDLRIDTQLASELIIKQINEFNDDFIRNINQYEKESIQTYETNRKTRPDEFNHFLGQLKRFHNEWTQYLKENQQHNHTSILNANETANNLIKEAESQLLKLDTFIFNGKKLKFEKSENKLCETLVGSFVSEAYTNTSILSTEQFKQLMRIINFSEDIKWRLIYQATTHGFTAKSFHSRCDSQRNNLILIKSAENNYVFGGFTREEWSGKSCYKTDPSAFIFSFTNKDKTPLLMRCFRPACAIYCNSDFGPKVSIQKISYFLDFL